MTDKSREAFKETVFFFLLPLTRFRSRLTFFLARYQSFTVWQISTTMLVELSNALKLWNRKKKTQINGNVIRYHQWKGSCWGEGKKGPTSSSCILFANMEM